MIYGIFDSVNTGTQDNPVYDRTFDADYLSDLFAFLSGASGVSGFAVAPGEGMTVTVTPGAGIINGRFAKETDNTVLDVGAGNTTRTDMIVLRCDHVQRKIELAVVQGSVTPTRTSNIFELCLATVNIPAGASTITAANITDTRADPKLCGIVSGVSGGSATPPEQDGPTIYVQPTQPENMKPGDLWFW